MKTVFEPAGCTRYGLIDWLRKLYAEGHRHGYELTDAIQALNAQRLHPTWLDATDADQVLVWASERGWIRDVGYEPSIRDFKDHTRPVTHAWASVPAKRGEVLLYCKVGSIGRPVPRLKDSSEEKRID